eukprot:TRINITY_DN108908_c0_g1_i1.p1 TRINITY_DN108908_c0_g1~~TRINITY_DN108908_c0_g1_i1.p1  ORF type:complete len:591 (+),score=111.23 TRINITY_DN108908_c0_g1_i1:104-1774(+)
MPVQSEAKAIGDVTELDISAASGELGFGVESALLTTPETGSAEMSSGRLKSLLLKTSETRFAEMSECFCRLSKMRVVAVGLAVALMLVLAWTERSKFCIGGMSSKDDLQQKVEANLSHQLADAFQRIKDAGSNRTAHEMVERATATAGQTVLAKWKQVQARQTKVRKLPNLFQNIQAVNRLQKQVHDNNTRTNLERARRAQCAFNVWEAATTTAALGVNINSIVRTCAPPRESDSELACSTNAGFLVDLIGLTASKLSLAASNCAETIDVDAICSAGITGLIGALGQISAAAALAGVCKRPPPQTQTDKVSELGQRRRRRGRGADARRLIGGAGRVGNGIQCLVDADVVAINIANMGLAINAAANSPNCKREALESQQNKKTGFPSALCTIDVGGAVTYFSNVIAFLNLAIINCKDFIDPDAICAASISSLVAGAAAIAPSGAAIHAACRWNKLAKKELEATSEASAGYRRLSGGNVTNQLNVSWQRMGYNSSSLLAAALNAEPSQDDQRRLMQLMTPALDGEVAKSASESSVRAPTTLEDIFHGFRRFRPSMCKV